jgi:hypothetical protein
MKRRVSLVEELRHTYRILLEKPGGRKFFQRRLLRGAGDMDWVRVNCFKMAYSTVQRQVSVTVVTVVVP